MLNRRFLLVFAALLVPAAAWAQVYKCVDASGRTVYLQSPCPAGQSSKVLSTKPPAEPQTPSQSKPGAKPPLTPEQAYQKRQKDREEADKKTAEESADAKRKQEACQRSREQVTRFEAGGRIAGMDSKGERYYLDDDQIAREKAKAQASVNEWCQ